MITLDDLKNSFYAENLFSLHQGKVVIEEKKNKGQEGKLQKVTLLSDGQFVECSNAYLQKTKEVFKKVDSNFSFQKDCDGIFLLDKDGKQYFIIIELKSGFDTKAFYQIASSYIRCKAMLRNIATFDASLNYEEKAFIISYSDKEKKYDSTSNASVLASKRCIMDSVKGEVINNLRIRLKTQKKVSLKNSDFDLKNMAIAKDLLLDNLEVNGITLEDGITAAEVDIDKWL